MLDSYYQRYADELTSEGVDSSQVDEAVKGAGWVDEKGIDTRNFFDRSVANDVFLSKVKENYTAHADRTNAFAVVLSTGSYDPVHNGHVEMMSKAKAAVEEQGFSVLAGVMSAGHDGYVREQKNGPGDNAFTRGMFIEQFLSAHKDNVSGWLVHDGWESMVAPLPVNFTTVIDWVRAQLSYLDLADEVRVFYVFGEDNMSFAHPLVKQRGVLPVIVQRQGYEMSPRVAEYVVTYEALYVESHNNLSSTTIREAKLNTSPYVIRKDAGFATSYLKDSVGSEYEQRVDAFSTELHNVFTEVFDDNVHVIGLDVADQLKSTTDFLSTNFDPSTRFLSADKYLTGENIERIQCSRVFTVNTSQKHAGYLRVQGDAGYDQNRPYVFIDDDIATGYTVEELKKKYLISGAVSMLNVIMPYGVKDIVDERDFLIGAKHGGLVCESSNGVMRFPYVFPYVNLHTRAKVPMNKIKAFSATIWELNRRFYRGTGLTFGQLKNNDFALHSGVPSSALVEGYCERMRDLLGGVR